MNFCLFPLRFSQTLQTQVTTLDFFSVGNAPLFKEEYLLGDGVINIKSLTKKYTQTLNRWSLVNLACYFFPNHDSSISACFLALSDRI